MHMHDRAVRESRRVGTLPHTSFKYNRLPLSRLAGSPATTDGRSQVPAWLRANTNCRNVLALDSFLNLNRFRRIPVRPRKSEKFERASRTRTYARRWRFRGSLARRRNQAGICAPRRAASKETSGFGQGQLQVSHAASSRASASGLGRRVLLRLQRGMGRGCFASSNSLCSNLRQRDSRSSRVVTTRIWRLDPKKLCAESRTSLRRLVVAGIPDSQNASFPLSVWCFMSVRGREGAGDHS